MHVLEMVATSAGTWNWGTFFETLIATVAGATVALIGAWLLARRDRQTRYHERLSDALARLDEVLSAEQDLLRVAIETGDSSATNGWSNRLAHAIKSTRMTARHRDIRMMEGITQVLNWRAHDDPPTRWTLVAEVRLLLVKWSDVIAWGWSTSYLFSFRDDLLEKWKRPFDGDD